VKIAQRFAIQNGFSRHGRRRYAGLPRMREQRNRSRRPRGGELRR
jgi:hypothetical protein